MEQDHIIYLQYLSQLLPWPSTHVKMATRCQFVARTIRSRPSLSSSLAKPATSICARTYHSHDHPAPPSKFSASESLILSSAYPFVPTHGFTLSTLALGAKEAGYLDASVNLFPNGAASLVEWHLHVQKNALSERAKALWEQSQQQTNLQAGQSGGKKVPGVGGKVKELTWKRLMGNKEVIGRWQEVCSQKLSSCLNI